MPRERTLWFAMIDGREAGPMSQAELALRLATDTVDEETYVWKEGMGEWLPAAKVQDLAPIFHARVQAQQSKVRPPPPPAAAKAKAKRAPVAEEEIVLDDAPPAPKQIAAAPVQAAAPPEAPPTEMTPPETTPLPDEEDESTVLEMLPLGERVHQEAVAQDLFDPNEISAKSSGKTGAFAIDSIKWAYAKAKREEKPQTAKSADLIQAMKATAAKPAGPSEPVRVEMATPSRPAVSPVEPVAARPTVVQIQRSRLPSLLVLAGIGLGGLLLAFAIFFLLRALL